MTLHQSLVNMQAEPSENARREFAAAFRKLADDNTQVYTAVKKLQNGYAIDTAEHNGSVYCVMFSEPSEVRHEKGGSTATIFLRSLIDSAYANPHIAGITIDPFSAFPVYIHRKDLQIISGMPDPRLITKNWGKGIPKYSEGDLMVAEEAMEFAMEIVAKYGLENSGYEIIDTNSGLTAFPNFALKKGDELLFVAVDVALAPNAPKLKDETKQKMLEAARENGAKAIYAPVSFASADPERMAASLALCGDSFIGTFLGFIELS